VAQQQQINSNTTSYQGTTSSFSLNALSLNKVKQEADCTNYKQDTNKWCFQSSKSIIKYCLLGSGIADDMQVHIVTNGHVVGDVKGLDITFPDINN
jgi:hypothetical protein